jgi:hypothetical protein
VHKSYNAAAIEDLTAILRTIENLTTLKTKMTEVEAVDMVE